MESRPAGAIERLRGALRVRHYSPRTEEAYVGRARRFAAFHRFRDPHTLSRSDISMFVTHLATQGVSASTQNQALAALLFLYQTVLGLAMPELRDITRARPSTRLPVVLSHREVAQLLSRLAGVEWLMAALLSRIRPTGESTSPRFRNPCSPFHLRRRNPAHQA